MNLGDIWNGTIGNLSFWDNENGDSAALRARLEGLGDKPYAQAALVRLQEMNQGEGGFDKNTDGQELRGVYLNELRDYMATLPPEQRFAELKTAVAAVDVENQFSPLLNRFDQATQGVQDALAYAVTNNPRFVDHIGTLGSGGPLDSMLSEDVLKDPQFAGPISDILTTIGNNPDYDFAKLDAVGVAAGAYFAEEDKTAENGRNDELVKQRRREMLEAVRDAGGNIPAIANLDMDMLMQFFNDLFNGDMNLAISNLANGLGLQGEQLEGFNELMQPIAGIMKFMGQDYYDYGMHYGPQLAGYGANAWGTVDGIMNGVRVQQTNGVTTITSADGSTVIEGPDGRDIDVAAVLDFAETLSPHDAEALRAQVEAGDMSGLTSFIETIAPHSAESIRVSSVESERTVSASGEALTTEVASLDSAFNPNSSGERTDGYRPDTPAAPASTRTYTHSVGGYEAALT